MKGFLYVLVMMMGKNVKGESKNGRNYLVLKWKRQEWPVYFSFNGISYQYYSDTEFEHTELKDKILVSDSATAACIQYAQ